MLRVTTVHASSAAATARYYARYLTAAPGETPGVWSGRQAAGLGLSGTVSVDALELLLSGRDPGSGTPLGRELFDRYTSDGRVVRAVSGFDATFSAPKSISVWWALTGDQRLLDAHDVAVTSALAHVERFGSTTRIRRDGGRLHPDSGGLTIASFRQTTSRADDPQIHTHAVISAKVQSGGRWLALDGRYLKRHQRMLGGIYQSVLRSELTCRFGVAWDSIVNGQAEIVGVDDELVAQFSKRAGDIDDALDEKVDEFRLREGREPSRWERAALTREASADTRTAKSGLGVADLAARWRTEAARVGWTPEQVVESIEAAGREVGPADVLTLGEILDAVSRDRSTWGRPDVMQAICDGQRPVSQTSGHRWAEVLERAADRTLEHCVDLDPPDPATVRRSDGRSRWIEPTAPRFTSDAVLAVEERIVTWAMGAQANPPSPSSTVRRDGLDIAQAETAASVAGGDRLVLVVGPAGAGKTRMLAAATADLTGHGRVVFGLAPTAKAARVLETATRMRSDTVAKLLHEWRHPWRPPDNDYMLPAGATVVVDEAGMLSTPALHRLVELAERERWRLALVGDHRQLQAVGRGGLFAELCTNGRTNELHRLHRFTHLWEAAASLELRSGHLGALDAYQHHGRIIAGTLDDHLGRIAGAWIAAHRRGDIVALVASTNDHVDAINRHVQTARLAVSQIDPYSATTIAGGEVAHLGDVVVTRRNDRRLVTSARQPVRNRETWTVNQVHSDGALTVTQRHGNATITLPVDYVRSHVRLGYAATEHGYQSDTATASISLVTAMTTRRGLYVAATRGRDRNQLCVVTDSHDVAEARDVLEVVLASDRADIPAVTQRRTLATSIPPPPPPPPPRRTPRCRIPEWFDPLRDDTIRALRRAEREVDEAAVQRRLREAERAELQRHISQAEADYVPYLDAVNQAKRDHQTAESRLHDAYQQVDDATLGHRRDARRHVAVAQDRLTGATAALQAAKTSAEPLRRWLNYTAIELRQHEQHDRTADQLDRWAGHDDRHSHLRGIDDALRAWHQWAIGGNVTTTRLANAVRTLESDASSASAPSYGALARAVRDWAVTKTTDLGVVYPPTRPTAIGHESPTGLGR